MSMDIISSKQHYIKYYTKYHQAIDKRDSNTYENKKIFY